MKCGKCSGLMRLEEEFSIRGSVVVTVCIICGYRGGIVEDRQIVLCEALVGLFD